MSRQLRRPFTSLALALTVLLCPVARFTMDAAAAEWQPSEPLKLVVPSGPGSGADQFTRLVAETIKRERLLPVAVEVFNKGGASGAISINFMAQKKRDATHLLSVTSNFLSTPLRNKDLPSYRDFEPVAVMAHDTNSIQVLASSPYRTIHDLIEAARTRPVINAFGTFGGADHIIGHQLGEATAVKFKIVVFKGGGEAQVALLGGHVDFTAGNPSEVKAHVQSGQLRVLAVVGDRRLPVFPDAPTLKELGINMGPTYSGFRGFVAPAGVSNEAIKAYALLIRKIMGTAAWKRYVVENALVEEYLGPSEMAAFLERRNEGIARMFAELGSSPK